MSEHISSESRMFLEVVEPNQKSLNAPNVIPSPIFNEFNWFLIAYGLLSFMKADTLATLIKHTSMNVRYIQPHCITLRITYINTLLFSIVYLQFTHGKQTSIFYLQVWCMYHYVYIWIWNSVRLYCMEHERRKILICWRWWWWLIVFIAGSPELELSVFTMMESVEWKMFSFQIIWFVVAWLCFSNISLICIGGSKFKWEIMIEYKEDDPEALLSISFRSGVDRWNIHLFRLFLMLIFLAILGASCWNIDWSPMLQHDGQRPVRIWFGIRKKNRKIMFIHTLCIFKLTYTRWFCCGGWLRSARVCAMLHSNTHTHTRSIWPEYTCVESSALFR